MGFASVAMALSMVSLSSVCCIMLKLSVEFLKWPQGLDEIPPPRACSQMPVVWKLLRPDGSTALVGEDKRLSRVLCCILISKADTAHCMSLLAPPSYRKLHMQHTVSVQRLILT